ncbi:unnamed protein product [Phyllotreta striolata]|uniref:Uncharacterized protein n=1 Tax=Phyllotreta striolata TaxID=444603 RepID=A0A9N9TWP8_PHYSR|nr:unnamed protein product [Phyllotreta striolata]
MKYYNSESSSSTSSMTSEKKSSLILYTNKDNAPSKVGAESEVQFLRDELEKVQNALRLQAKRCRQLVAEYTRKLQEKEHQYVSEKVLRDDQLAKVLRALLIFEARLRQEQKFITKQLNEKDRIIRKQNNEIKKLLINQYCKNCRQYYSSSPIQESLDSSTEYVLTDCQDYQSSNFESLDSSSETYGTLSEKDFKNSESSYEENSSKELEPKNVYTKNCRKDSVGRRNKKIPHRKSNGTYFEVLKLRNDSNSPLSNDDNTSNDYDNLDSLPPENVDIQINTVTENIEQIFEKTHQIAANNGDADQSCDNKKKSCQITESIPVFEGGEETNDNWYASASDQEDDEHRNIYRNNPVLECMNQILLQNINDTLISPPKTPNIERKSTKNKKVTFSDEEVKEETNEERLPREENPTEKQDYYETPLQNSPNFYETPQSIYSNDYEQILSKCNETFTNPDKNQDQYHHYIDMDEKKKLTTQDQQLIKKSKIQRVPPALPPKPINLVSKYKIQGYSRLPPSEKSSEAEPDYCSISELNLPQNKSPSFKKINVVAEINSPTSLDVINKLNSSGDAKSNESDLVNLKDTMVVKKCVEKMNIQLAKQIKPEPISPKKIETIDIPKLPQVSEILIPESEDEDNKEKDGRISQDNYMRNNTQIMKLKDSKETPARKPIVMGSTVSNLISTFNNQQFINDIKHSPEKNKPPKFPNFDNPEKRKVNNFEKFDLRQNFEEFKLDDCDIEEYTVEEIKTDNEDGKETTVVKADSHGGVRISKTLEITNAGTVRSSKNLDITPTLSRTAIELFKKHLEKQLKNQNENKNKSMALLRPNEPTYEHFLECTGLSTKSLLSPSRLLSNHKNVLKPKEVKLKPTGKAASLYEKHGSPVKYWSEPYL